MNYRLARFAKAGDIEKIRELLDADGCGEINTYDPGGLTPLMHAVSSPAASLDLVRLLLDRGANVHQETTEANLVIESVMVVALQGGDPSKVALLVERGADLLYRRESGFTAILDAVYGRELIGDSKLIELLRLLISNRVELDTVSGYQESALRVLSRIGRFDAIRVLLEAGADSTQLGWSALHWAVGLGSIDDIERQLAATSSLEERDWWERTPWLLAIQTGDVAKASLLLDRGADRNARGRCGKPPLHYGIDTFSHPMVQWLLEIGMPVEQSDDHARTPLIAACKCSNLAAVEALIEAGANVNAEGKEQKPLNSARTAEIASRLLAAGADRHDLSIEGRRALLGFDPDPDAKLLDVTPGEFREGRTRRFGVSNPDRLNCAFCQSMIRAGISGAQATEMFRDEVESAESPVWSAQRFGQSLTLLPDGRIIEIAGEHEDFYHDDFCIYNDVFVHHPDGSIEIFGYPEDVFPPTDFHSATLLGDFIYIIGSLGYHGRRGYGTTQVFRLDTKKFQIERVTSTGAAPGWINSQSDVVLSAHEIRISGGYIHTSDGNEEIRSENGRDFVFDINNAVWRSP